MADDGRRWRTMAHRRVTSVGAVGLRPWRPALALLVLTAGCSPSAPVESNHVADSGAATAGQTKPTTPATVPTVGNPNRIYQLKDLPKVDLVLKGHKVHAWVMDDEAKQQEGMMFLTDGEVMGDEGMLFAFPSTQSGKNPDGSPQGFWMHNTLIPLDIVYLSPAGKVLNVAHGKVQDDTNLPPGGAYRNVIELKAGTAARYGLKTGDVVKIPKV